MAQYRRDREQQDEFQDRVIRIDRTRKTVKGGRISSSRVCAVVGDGKGSVGFGMGRALSATDGIAKALAQAKKRMIRVPMDGYTIPHAVQAKVGGAVILLKPASRGTGIIAGGAVRQIMEVSGIRNVLTKSLQLLRNPADVAALRGKTSHDILGRDIEDPYADAAALAAAEERRKSALGSSKDDESDNG